MSDIINILPDSVANQIAAGEVVDRPASCVKELLENAIDAGATQIQLIVKDAGRTLIQVIDNGKGMSDSDARLCFERHATSKIHNADDLFAIRTMGFRGEALASIAAVAQVELKTRQPDNELGTCVVIEGSDVKGQEPCSTPVGTSIAVKNLFFNIPARRNFLKKDSIELSHIDEIFRRVALVNNEVAFSFHSNGKLLYELRSSNKAQRIAAICNMDGTDKLFPVKEETDVLKVEGYVGKPEYARKTRGDQYLFVNNRFFKHQKLSYAVETAYRDMIPERTYPSYFLYITVDPSRLDVNIHPTKTEVRFVDEQAVTAILKAATKKALGQFRLANELEFNPSDEIDFSLAPKDYVPQMPTVKYNESFNPFGSSKPSSGTNSGRNIFNEFSPMQGDAIRHAGWGQDKQRPTADDWKHFFEGEETVVTPSEATSPMSVVFESSDEEPEGNTSSDNPLLLMGRYIVTTLRSSLLLVDLRRATERIAFERLMTRSEQGNGGVGAQQLLFPVTCTFSPSDAELIGESLEDIRRMGFIIEKMGQCNVVVSATPPDVKESELQSLFDQMAADMKGEMLHRMGDRRRALCMSMARQMSRGEVSHMGPDAMQALIADLFACQVPNITPSGKKIIVTLNADAVEEMFR
ncbi:MAG: DNA mismatch repair endonuclease MutL [Bacteroidales bacterium]|nr:DNA mismatch repair endonuclease MutL [Bacteroidales bacterium]